MSILKRAFPRTYKHINSKTKQEKTEAIAGAFIVGCIGGVISLYS